MRHVQVAVVGGGIAGSSAVLAAAQNGTEAVLLDENPSPVEWGTGSPIQDLVDQARELGADLRFGSTVWGLFKDNVLGVVSTLKSYHLQADRVILATGSTDLPVPFPGGSLPGVFTFRAMNIMLNTWRIMPWKRFVLAGDGDEMDQLQAEIERCGGEIVLRVSSDDAINLLAFGDQGVEAVEFEGVMIEADVVVVNMGRQPDIELALMAECATAHSEDLGGFVPIRDDLLRTSQPSIVVVGDAAGLCDSSTAKQEGSFAGICAAHALGLVGDDELSMHQQSFVEHVRKRLEILKLLRPQYVQV